MSAKLFLAVLLFSCSVINSSTISLSTGANFLALLLNLMGLVVLMDCFGDGGVGGNGDGGMLNDHNLCYLFHFGRMVTVLLWRDTVSAGRRHTNGYELCPSSSRFIFILV